MSITEHPFSVGAAITLQKAKDFISVTAESWRLKGIWLHFFYTYFGFKMSLFSTSGPCFITALFLFYAGVTSLISGCTAGGFNAPWKFWGRLWNEIWDSAHLSSWGVSRLWSRCVCSCMQRIKILPVWGFFLDEGQISLLSQGSRGSSHVRCLQD